VSTSRLGVDMGSIGLREVREVEDPKASEPDFTGVTVPQASLSDVRGDSVELGVGGRDG
jgi:hypothetical protein